MLLKQEHYMLFEFLTGIEKVGLTNICRRCRIHLVLTFAVRLNPYLFFHGIFLVTTLKTADSNEYGVVAVSRKYHSIECHAG